MLSRNARAVRFALVVATGLTLLSLTGAPTPKFVAKLAAAGMGAGPAGLLLHLTPIVVGTLLCGLGQWVAIGQTRPVRVAIYAALGLATGLVMGLCLDLFVAATAWVNTAFGPSTARGMHAFGWAAAAIATFWGLLLAAIALFGSPAARVLQDAAEDPECADVRPRDRVVSRVAAIGMISSGLCLGALTLLDQTAASGLPGQALAAVSAIAGLISAYSNWAMWKAADEFQQRAILIAYAAALTVLTTGAFLWAIATSLGGSLKLTPYDVFLAMILVQSATAMVSGYAAQVSPYVASSARRAA